jgi:hypothetical protein
MIRSPELAEHLWTSGILGLIRETRNDVNMHMPVSGILSEERHVRTDASRYLFQGSRYAHDYGPECRSLVVVKVADRADVSSKDEHDPALDCRAERMNDVPVSGAEDVVSGWRRPGVAQLG